MSKDQISWRKVDWHHLDHMRGPWAKHQRQSDSVPSLARYGSHAHLSSQREGGAQSGLTNGIGSGLGTDPRGKGCKLGGNSTLGACVSTVQGTEWVVRASQPFP